MWWMPLAMAGIGALQARDARAAQERAQNKRQEQQNRINAYSPLLGTTPQVLDPTPELPTVMGGAMGGAFSGFNQMQNYEQSQLQNQLMREKAAYYRSQQGNPNIVNNYDEDDFDFLTQKYLKE